MRSLVWTILILLTVAPLVAATPDGCDAGPQIIITSNASIDPALAAKEISTLKNYVSDQLIQVLKDAAADPVTWDRAMRNPRAFLSEKGFPPPNTISVRLAVPPIEDLTNGNRTLWEPNGCPTGMIPVTTAQVVQVCDHWLVFWHCIVNADGTSNCFTEIDCLSHHFQFQQTTACTIDVVAVGSH